MIERYVHWNDDIGEWQLKCVAYTGNNMRKQLDSESQEHENQLPENEMWNVYMSYGPEVIPKSKPKMKRSGSGIPKPVSSAGSLGVKPRKKSAIPRPKSLKSPRRPLGFN